MSGLLGLIERERGGEAVDRALLKSLARMFANLGTYAEVSHPIREGAGQLVNWFLFGCSVVWRLLVGLTA